MLLRPLYFFSTLVVIEHFTHLSIIYTNWLPGPYTPIFMAGDTLLLAFLPAGQLYRHCTRKGQPLAVSDSDIASRILKARVLATIAYSIADSVHTIISKDEPTTRELTILGLLCLLSVAVDALVSIWTFVMLIFGLVFQDIITSESEVDFIDDNRTILRWSGIIWYLHFLRRVVRMRNAEALLNPKVVPDPEAVPDSKGMTAVPSYDALDAKA
ncbi:hypothetical protein EYR38_001925 [Pleurotus pulmonarius]|nr:hypothetical protein EYR38_001925 [Pleurotus pulmonarius]